MNCPICDSQLLDDVLRCPNCNSPLTVWKNLDCYADQAYRAGLDLFSKGDTGVALEMLSRSIAFAPTEPRYLACYGRLLAMEGRANEATMVLDRANQLSPSDENKKALERARTLARASTDDSEIQPSRRPLGIANVEAEGEAARSKAWDVCFQIERDWSTFARFAAILDWGSDGISTTTSGPINYLKGVRAYSSGDDLTARRFFKRSISGEAESVFADVYLVLLSKPAEVESTIEALIDGGRTSEKIARVLDYAAGVDREEYRQLIPYILMQAVKHQAEHRDSLAEQLVASCQDRQQGELAIDVLKGCLSATPSQGMQLSLGDLYQRLGNDGDAELAYLNAANESPEDWRPVARLSELFATNDPERSLKYLSDRLDNGALDEEGRVALCERRFDIHNRERRYNEALSDARALLDLRPTDERYAACVRDLESRVGGPAGGEAAANTESDGECVTPNAAERNCDEQEPNDINGQE